jgi:hypothetical protein
MNAKRTRYTAGFPTGALVPGASLARYERFDTTTQQILDLQKSIQSTNDTIAVLQDELSNIKTDIVIRTEKVVDSPNLIANGDCSQWTFHKPIVGNALPNNSTYRKGWIIQNRTVPIMDRWYHTCCLNSLGLGPNFSMSADQVTITRDPLLGNAQPLTAKYGLEMHWTGTTTTPSIEAATNSSVVYGICGIQHRIPDVTQFQNGDFTLSFWIKSTHAFPLAVVVHRQYNEARPAVSGTGQALAASLRPPGLEYIGCQVVNSGLVWQQVSVTFTFDSLKPSSTYPIAPFYNGLLIQICPYYYVSYVTDAGTTNTFAPAGTAFHNTPIDCDFTITEIQLLKGSTAVTQFFSRLDESTATTPYIQRIAATTDASISGAENMGYGSISHTTMNLDGDGVDWPTQRFTLPLSTPLIQKPNMVAYLVNGSTLGAIMMNKRRAEQPDHSIVWDSDALRNTGDDSLTIFNVDGKSPNMACRFGSANFTGLNILQDQCQHLVDENVTIMTGAKPLPLDSGSPSPQGSIGVGTLTFPTAFPTGTNPTVFVSPYTSDTTYFYSCKITDTSPTGFNYNWWRRDTTTSSIQNNGPLSMFWIAFADVAEGAARSVAITQGNWPTNPSGHTVVNFTNQQATYTGNGTTGDSYATGNITQIRRLTFNNMITTPYQLGVNVSTPPPPAIVDSYHGHVKANTRVESATLQLDQSAAFVVMFNEFDIGRVNVDDFFNAYDFNYQGIYTIPYYPNPPN